MKLILALTLSLALTACNQEEIPIPIKLVTWTAPSEREDGTALSLSEIDYFMMYCDNATVKIVPHATELWVADWLVNCSMTTVDTEGRESRRTPSVW